MQSLLVPVLAQLLTVGVGANTEARYVASDLDKRFESFSSVGVGANLRLPHLSLDATYSPSLTVSPLEREPRSVLVTDSLNGTVTADYVFVFKRSSLGFSQSATYTVENPALQALNGAAPVPSAPASSTPPPATPGGGQPEQPTSGAADARVGNIERVQFWTLRSSVNYDNLISQKTTLSADVNYQLTAGFGDSRVPYPLVQGPDGRVEVLYRLTARGTLTSTLGAQYGWSETGNKGFISGLAERYSYQFTRRTRGELGAGVAYSFSQVGNGPRTHGIFPVGSAALDHYTRLYGGALGLSTRVTTAPVLDVTTAVVDPRLGFALNAGWSRRRWSLNANASCAISMAGGEERGALNSIGADAGAGYDLGAGFRADAGVRLAWQTFEGSEIIPASTVVFLGVSWGIGTQFGRAPTEPQIPAAAAPAAPR
jgi:hypothetical protein